MGMQGGRNRVKFGALEDLKLCFPAMTHLPRLDGLMLMFPAHELTAQFYLFIYLLLVTTNKTTKKKMEAPASGTPTPWVGVSLMPHPQYRRAIQPLLDRHLIDAIEWR
jgi:hypothetical protein